MIRAELGLIGLLTLALSPSVAAAATECGDDALDAGEE